MKKLSLVWLAVLAFGIALTSCENLGVAPDEYDSASIDFMFLASTADNPNPQNKGGKCKITQIEVSALPSAVSSYISTNYAGSSIKHAGTDSVGNYLVHITLSDASHKGLLFDKTGKFISERSGKGKKGEKVAVSALPTAVTTYISTTYAGSTVKGAFKNTDGNFIVLIEKSDATKLALGFDSAGAFKGELSMKDFGKRKKGGK